MPKAQSATRRSQSAVRGARTASAAQAVSMADFRADLARGASSNTVVRFVASGDPAVAVEDRILSFVFSDASVDRYGDTIDARGWVLDNFKANPIALFGHDANNIDNVIGSAKNVRVEGTKLIGDIVFATAEESATADTVYKLAKAGHLRTVSVGFAPLEWTQTKDKSRPGGIDFKKQELLEISIVPIPANPNALVQARAAGIDVDRLALLATAEPDAVVTTRAVGRVVTKDLYDVATMADVVTFLAYITGSAAWEAEYEGDGSDVPSRLADLLKAAGQILIDMTAEEVAELIANVTGEDGVKAAGVAFARGVRRAERRGIVDQLNALPEDAALGLAHVFKAIGEGRSVMFIDKGVETPIVRAGKVLSADNESTLRAAHGQISEACASIMAICDKAAPAESTAMPNDAEAKALRARKASAMKMQASV